MCGIFGIAQQNNAPVDPGLLQKAIELVKHRGPDGQAFYVQDHWGFAHSRLAIIDLSKDGVQPMHYKGHVVTYNGEIYNYLELRSELQQNGYSFTTQTDTEVLLASYDFWGEDCVHHFNGMWAFAIYDPHKNQLFCSRDRFGIKPFYYTIFQKQFCFASEIKQFTSLPNWTAQLNKTIAYEFLIKGYHDHQSATFFQGIHQLKGGHHLLYNLRDHTFKIQAYYQIKKQLSPSPGLNEAEAVALFQEKLLDAIRLRLRSDVSVGTALSGGLDSSAILCGMQELLKKEGQTILPESVSCCFPGSPIDESSFIDAVVEKTRHKNHKVFPSLEQMLADWDKVTWMQDEPIASASVIAQYQVFKTAKAKGLTVMLDGQGADEILAGYEKFYAPLFKNKLKKNPLGAIIDVFRFFYLHQIAPLQALNALQRFRKKDHLTKIDWLKETWPIDPEHLFARSADDSLTQTSINLLSEIGMPILLHYEDRNSMAASVESRLPFLDHRLVEFCLNLPDQLKINKARRKHILREAMRPFLPDSIYRRYNKLGFATPQEAWIEEAPERFSKMLEETQQSFPEIFGEKWLPWSQEVLKSKQRAHYPLLWRAISFGRWGSLFLGK